MTLDSQSDKRLRLNIRREKLEALLRDIIFHNSQIKYGKKATEKLCEILFGTGKSNSQKEQIRNIWPEIGAVHRKQGIAMDKHSGKTGSYSFSKR